MHISSSSHTVINRWLLQTLVAGASFSLLLPFAQAKTAALGWLPMWLVGLPLAAWLGWRCLNQIGSMPASVGAVIHGRRRLAQASTRGRRAARPMPMATRRSHARA